MTASNGHTYPTELTLSYRVYRIMQLITNFHEVAKRDVVDIYANSLRGQSIYSQRHIENPAIDFGNRALSKAYTAVADAVDAHHKTLATEARKAIVKATQLARVELSALSAFGTVWNTDFVAITLTGVEKPVRKLIVTRVKRLILKRLQELGLPENAVTFINHSPEGEEYRVDDTYNEVAIEANVMAHPELPVALQDICRAVSELVDDEIEVDVFHRAFEDQTQLIHQFQGQLSVDELSLLEREFKQWCEDQHLPIKITAPEPNINLE